MTKARIAMLAFTSVIMIALEGSTAVAQLAGDGVCDRRGYAILSPWDLSSFPPGQARIDSYLYRQAMECYINAERSSQGLPALIGDSPLNVAARLHVVDAVAIKWWCGGCDPHTNPVTGTTPDYRIKKAGFCGGRVSSTGEIAYGGYGQGSASVQAAMRWWMNSTPHRAAILNANFRRYGFSYQKGSAFPYWPDVSSGTFIVTFGSCY